MSCSNENYINAVKKLEENITDDYPPSTKSDMVTKVAKEHNLSFKELSQLKKKFLF